MAKQEEIKQIWRERIAAQQASGLSVRRYCKEHGIGEHSFYTWRLRQRQQPEAAGFALVEAKREEQTESAVPMAELILREGMMLRVPCEEASVRVLLQAVRALA